MTDTVNNPKGLESKLLPELKQLATNLGIKSTGLRKGDLVAAISAAQPVGGSSAGASSMPS